MMSGTWVPGTVRSALSPFIGPALVCDVMLFAVPLSLVKMMYVLSAMPSSSTAAVSCPTRKSRYSMLAPKFSFERMLSSAGPVAVCGVGTHGACGKEVGK